MNSKKTIIIKTPLMRNIRNNLRLLLIEVIIDRKSRLREDLRDIWQDTEGNVRTYSFEDDVYNHHSRDILKEIDVLNKILDRSICFCPSCRRADKNMIRNPVTGVWFCIPCYQENHEFYKNNEKYARLFP